MKPVNTFSRSALRILGFQIPCLLLALPAASVQGQDFTQAPHFGEVTLSSGFTPDPHVIQLTAGGNSNASDASASCVGNVSNAPDYRLRYTAGNWPLGIFVDSDVDTTLLINDPSGNWHCNDDSEFLSGLNPGIFFENPASGRYDIWVGTYSSSNNFSPATLVITEYGTDSWSGLDIGSSVDEEDLLSGPYFGDDSGLWPEDGQCDDPRFSGFGMASRLVSYNRLADATDCGALYASGRIEENYRFEQRFTGNLGSSDPVMPGRGHFHTRRFQGVLGERILLDLRSQDFDTYLIVRGPGGWEDSNDDYGDTTRSLLLLDIEDAGEYEIIITSFSSNATGRYELIMDRMTDFTGIGEGLDVTGSLSAASKIEPGEQYGEAYEFRGVAGTDLEVGLSSSHFDTFLEILMPDNEVLENDDWENSAAQSYLRFNVPDDGIYTVIARSYSIGETGDFRLQVRPYNAAAPLLGVSAPVTTPAVVDPPLVQDPVVTPDTSATAAPVQNTPASGVVQFGSKL